MLAQLGGTCHAVEYVCIFITNWRFDKLYLRALAVQTTLNTAVHNALEVIKTG
jgi:hypothetical protein